MGIDSMFQSFSQFCKDLKLKLSVRGLVFKEVLIFSLLALFWISQTIALSLRHLTEYTTVTFFLLVLKPSILPPTKPGGWNGAYAIFAMIVNSTVAIAKVVSDYLDFETVYPECDESRLAFDFAGVHGWYSVETEFYSLLFFDIPVCVLVFILPKETATSIKFPMPKWAQNLPIHWKLIDEMICIGLMFIAGCMWPSILNAPYFCCALLFSLSWAFNIRWAGDRTFRFLLRILLIFNFLHQLALIVYQHPWIEQFVPPSNTYVRLSGLTQLTPMWCLEQEEEENNEEFEINYAASINRWTLLILFLSIRSYLGTRHVVETEDTTFPQEVEIIAETSTNDEEDITGLDEIDTDQKEKSPDLSLFRSGSESSEKFSGETNLEDLALGTINNSIMMIWSVMFHSWLGLLMLLWANIMWMIPRQNTAMGISSRALSIYTSFLILVMYTFSVDYDWPSHFGSLSLHELGLIVKNELKFEALLIKSSFTTIVLIVLRQYTTPYFVGLRIPISGFKAFGSILNVMWTRLAILIAIYVMSQYDEHMYKIIGLPLTLSILWTLLFPSYSQSSLRIFFIGLVFLAELKLVLTYVYQIPSTQLFLRSINSMEVDVFEKVLGLRELTIGTKTLFVHLWLTTLVAMVSTIFLTVFSNESYVILDRSWYRYQRYMARYALNAPGSKYVENPHIPPRLRTLKSLADDATSDL